MKPIRKSSQRVGKTSRPKTNPMRDAEEEIPEPSSPVCYLREFETRSTPAPSIQIKRAYEPPASTDGTRILVDRLWPRGVKRATLALDAWLKDAAPSPALRQWFHRDPQSRWREFQARYRAELQAHPQFLQPLYAAARRGPLTLVYGARDASHNHAIVLRDYLLAHPA